MSAKSAAIPRESPSNGSALRGRERECAELAPLLHATRAGHSAALVVSGAAGMGKSALLDDATERASGATVLRAVGVEAEYHLAFA